MQSIGYIITQAMMDNWCVITIFDLALGLSRQVSHLLLARGLQLSFTLIPSHLTVLEFYCQCSFGLFDCVTINSLLPNSLWSVVKCDWFGFYCSFSASAESTRFLWKNYRVYSLTRYPLEMFLWVTNNVKFVNSAEECPSTSGVALQCYMTQIQQYIFEVSKTIKISLHTQTRQLPLLQAQSSVWNHLNFLNNFLMLLLKLNEIFGANWMWISDCRTFSYRVWSTRY